jgi:hypothetical protein
MPPKESYKLPKGKVPNNLKNQMATVVKAIEIEKTKQKEFPEEMRRT